MKPVKFEATRAFAARSLTKRPPSKPYTGNKDGKGNDKPKVSFSSEWRPTEQPVWGRFVAGNYGICEAESCGGYVSCDAEGNYTCRNHLYAPGGKILKGKDGRTVLCGNTGVLKDTQPAAINFRAWIDGGGKTGKGTYVACNCWRGNRKDVPCLVCHYEEETKSWAKMSFAHNFLRLGTFHKKNDENTAYEAFEPCTGKNCSLCSKGSATQPGYMSYYNPGYNDKGYGPYNNLLTANTELGHKCRGCKEGYIFPSSYKCPSCKKVMLDISEEELEERRKYTGSEGTLAACPHCNKDVYPVENLECLAPTVDYHGTIVDAQGGCDKPERASLFDVDVYIQRIGEGNSSAIVVKQWVLRPLDQGQQEMAKPIDFQFLCESPPSRQAAKMHRINVFDPEDSGQNPKQGQAKRSTAVSYDK